MASNIKDSEMVWREVLEKMLSETDNLLEIDENTSGIQRFLLFTTYKLDIELFETQVLCNLIKDCGSLRETARLLKLEQMLESTCVTVLHDNQGMINKSKRSSVHVLPVKVNTGVFHPKIVLYGVVKSDKISEIALMAGSANLTRSGIGSNRESVFILPGKLPGRLCRDIELFLRQLKENYLDNFKETEAFRSIDFFISECDARKKSRFPNRRGLRLFATGPSFSSDFEEPLKKSIRECSDCICMSPYFPSDWPETGAVAPLPVDMLIDNDNLTDDAVWFCPAPDSNGRYCLASEFVNYCKENIGAQFKKERVIVGSKGKYRFIHAKVYRLENSNSFSLLIGSHNLTVAAWGGRNIETGKEVTPGNIEVSLFVECIGDFKKYASAINEDRFVLLNADFSFSAENEDEKDEEVPQYLSPILVIFDWETRQYNFSLFSSETYESYSVILPFIGEVKRSGSGKQPPEIVPAGKLIFADMSYSVVAVKKNGDLCEFKGFVFEMNTGCRTMAYESLLTYLKSLAGKIDPGGNVNGNERKTRGGNRTSQKKKEIFDIGETWYDFFYEAGQLCERLHNERANGGKRHLLEFIRLFEAELDDTASLDWLDRIKLWLLYKEVDTCVGNDYALLGIKKGVMKLGDMLKLNRMFELWVETCNLSAEERIGLEEKDNGK